MSGKKDKHPPQDLSALENSYRIVGELSARDNVREYLATRIEDGADVRILVEEAPRGDAGNALTLYAADVNLLAGLEHRNLIPIREGRWVAQDRFAVVTDRCQTPTLETLVSRGDSWSYPRIARILAEVNGLLEWARDQKVVHRALTLGTLHLEPDTDRVLASFIAQPLTRQGAPGADGDARTIAELAWTLITRGRDLPQSVEDSIGIVRPELPSQVIAAIDALLHGQRVGDTEPPTIPDFIGIVAMTDAIMRGEVNAAEVEATIYQEQLLEREAWAAKEQGYQEQLAEKERAYQEGLAEKERRMEEEREEMARTLTSERETMDRTLTAEREELSNTLADERGRMASERAELEQQMADERQRMADAHAELERQMADERTRMADAHAELERQIAEERKRLAEEREALLRELADERSELERQVANERKQLADERADLERNVAEERERLDRDRVEHEAELARERAAMAATIAEERAQLEQRITEERAQLEATLSEGQRRLLDDRTAAETALATARAEFEGRMAAQRAEFEATLASERDAFERAMIAERNALEADKEGFAVFNSAEREAIESERRALEELYLAYEAEGHVVTDAEDEARMATDDAAPDMPIARVTAALADYAPIAVAAPYSEPAPEPTDPLEPAETESGLTRDDAKRSRRAAWGIPASVILLVGIVTATAVGVGRGNDEARDAQPQREERPAATRTQEQHTAAPVAPTVIDSAGGTVVTPDSSTEVQRSEGNEPARRATVTPRARRSAPARSATAPPRAVSAPRDQAEPWLVRRFDTAAAAPASAIRTTPTNEATFQPANPVATPATTFPPTTMPTATPTVTPTAPRDTAPATPLPTIPPATMPQPTFPTVPPTA